MKGTKVALFKSGGAVQRSPPEVDDERRIKRVRVDESGASESIISKLEILLIKVEDSNKERFGQRKRRKKKREGRMEIKNDNIGEMDRGRGEMDRGRDAETKEKSA